MSNAPEPTDVEVFENPNSQAGNPTFLFLGGVGLIVFAMLAFLVAVFNPRGELFLHVTTTLPLIVAVGLLARGFSLLRSLPRRVVVGQNGIGVATNRSTRRYSWSEIGSAETANVLNSNKTCLRITDTAGKTIIRVDEAFPDYQRLTKLVESYIDAKPGDTSIRILARNARRRGLFFFVIGGFLGYGAVFVALETREDQRAIQWLSVKGVPGEGEIIRRFVAPNGVTKRIEYRIADSKVKNVEVEPVYWDQLEHATTVPVIYVPDEPDISRLELGEVKDGDFTNTSKGGGYIIAGLGCLMAIFFLSFSPFAWMGYDLSLDEKKRIWKIKRYGRVIWSSKKESLDQVQIPPDSQPSDPRDDEEI